MSVSHSLNKQWSETLKFYSLIIIFSQCFYGTVCQIYSRNFAGLTTVPRNIPDGSTWISLQFNLITTIDDSSFNYADFSSVTTLILYDNQIESISKAAFAGFTSLRTLLLSNNRLRELDLDCRDLPNLSELQLHNNLLAVMPAFHGNCSSLESLELSFNDIYEITSKDFENITNVNSIKLKSNGIINFQSFHGLSISMKEVTEIDLAYNELKLVNARAFEGFDKLYSIDLNYNKIQNLSMTSSDVPLVMEIKLDTNEIETFPKFYGVMDALKRLSVRHNQINYISPEGFENITNLEFLDLSHNQLTEIEIGVALLNLSSFQLESNLLSTMPKMAGHHTKPLSLNLYNNKLTGAAVVGFKVNFSISPDGILDLNLGSNLDLSNDLSPVMNYLFENFPGMEYLGLSNLQLTEMPDAQYDGVEKINLNFKHNQITSLNEELFKALSAVQEWTLDLNYNLISTFSNVLPSLNDGSKGELIIGGSDFECEKLCWMMDYK